MGVAGGSRTPRRPESITLIAAVCTTAVLIAAMVTAPTRGGIQFQRVAAAAGILAPHTAARRAPSPPPVRPPAGTPAVGALFTVSGGRLGSHFCTASVVDSPSGDLAITAAHCLSGLQPGQVAFVPGYHDGQQPYGVWQVDRVFVDQAWAANRSPSDDVAFLVLRPGRSGRQVQAVTGGEHLGIGWGPAQQVHVIGYPSDQERPITCQGETRPFGTGQMEFSCQGYTDGTSGSPFVMEPGPGGSEGTVVGVIGGYEQGGATAAVSYSDVFGPAVLSLYQAATAQG